MKNILLLAFTFFSLNFMSFGQISVTNTLTPEQLVQNVLLGFGVTASNVSVNGSIPNASTIIGNATFFDATTTTFNIPTGVLLTTGNGIGAIGPNNSGSYTNNAPPTANVSADPHLTAIANSGVTNGIVVEFDFIPAGDTISFQYIFGSDEYPEYSPSTFNDAFGFFLWGPGVSGPYALGGYPAGGANLAIIPGTTLPVTINNLGPGAGQYPAYYQNNLGGAAYGTAIQYDGTTTLLSANATVQCGQTYHIKLAICNVGDQAYDSGVFLQANSFNSEAVQVAVATVTGDTVVYEGCTGADFIFVRPEWQTADTLVVTYDIGGTATEGADFNAMINPVTFLPGEDSVILNLWPINDGITEGMEYLTITAYTVNSCGDTIVSQGTIWFLDEPNMFIDETDPTILCADDSVLVYAFAGGGFGPYTYVWSNGSSVVDSAYVEGSIMGPQYYYVTATDQCGYTVDDTITVTLNQTLAIDTLIQSPADGCNNPTGWVSATVSGLTGAPLYNWTGPGAGNPNFINATVWTDLSSGWYYFTVTDNVCVEEDSVFVDMDNPPFADFTATPPSGCTPLSVVFSNSSQNTTEYNWDFGNGNTNYVFNANNQSEIYTSSTTVTLTAYQSPICFDETSASISITTCGCTDPQANNYDPNAAVDDGSCTYPVPTVIVPNVFTPNLDFNNNYFYLTTANATSLELTILNRWGNEMFYNKTDLLSNPLGPELIGWNGLTPSGSMAGEGTYFYKYTITGIVGDIIEGHGFLQLVRD